MIQIVLRVLRDYGTWERGPRWSLILSAVALAGCLLIVIFGPAELRVAAAIGAFGALVVLQAAILYGYRHMVNEYALAQQAYLRGDYAEAIRLMEKRRQSGKARWRELALLSNAYRHVGQHDEALDAARAALVFAPEDGFPLYAFGRALLEYGDYVEAATVLQKAIVAGAPAEAALDVADACWQAGDPAGAREALAAFESQPQPEDPQRALLLAVLNWRLGEAEAPDAALVIAGLPGWKALEARCADTPYGSALAADRAAIEARSAT